MESAGAEHVFKGEPDATKISREEMVNIKGFTEQLIRTGKTNIWLAEYAAEPKRFTFKNNFIGGYKNWSIKWYNLKEEEQPAGS